MHSLIKFILENVFIIDLICLTMDPIKWEICFISQIKSDGEFETHPCQALGATKESVVDVFTKFLDHYSKVKDAGKAYPNWLGSSHM